MALKLQKILILLNFYKKKVQKHSQKKKKNKKQTIIIWIEIQNYFLKFIEKYKNN